MDGVVNGVYYCQMDRTQDLSNRMYDRNIPSAALQMNYNPRAVPTRYVKMPILDCRMPANVPCKKVGVYNPFRTFNPGTSAPFSGFASNIDQESRIQNRFFPIQKGAQSKFIPDSNSDLYKVNVRAPVEVKMTHPLLFKKEKFNLANMNKCNIGQKIFNNFTKYQVRNLPLQG